MLQRSGHVHGKVAHKYPRLVECAIAMTACDDPEPHCKSGVEMFMAGVAALAAARSA